MSTIRILPEDVSNRIAAGEVVERPASVVKELVENALDAGATQIDVHVHYGGRTLIKVVDNGCGMDAEDALLCLEAHATSKIRLATDIEHINSFGFRGEALPSIASVAKMELITRPENQNHATEVIIDGGVIKSVTETGGAPGTSITVKSLYYNVPARRKFMRNIKTEELHIQECVLLLAMANPTVGFYLAFDQKPIIDVNPNNDLMTRGTLLLGKDVMAAMLPVAVNGGEMKLSGYIARPGLTRSSRREQRIFINRRAIESATMYYAIRDAYHTLVMKGRYSPVILFLEMKPEDIDVNVHPAKREIRFRHDRDVSMFVSNGIRQALRALVTDIPMDTGLGIRPMPPQPWSLPVVTQTMNDLKPASGENHTIKPGEARTPLFPPSPENPAEGLAKRAHDCAAMPPGHTVDVGTAGLPMGTIPAPHFNSGAGTSVSAATRDEICQLRIIGAVAHSFLVAEGRQGLVLIDQHAAHERVLYEQILSAAKKKDGTRQQLLFPVTLNLSAADTSLLQTQRSNFSNLGFEIEDFGGNTFIITAVPPHFPYQNIGGLVREILDDLRAAPSGNKRVDEADLATAACKAAVKAHDKLTVQEMERLMEQLTVTELPYTCPHGRPTMINISFGEMEKRFGRRH